MILSFFLVGFFLHQLAHLISSLFQLLLPQISFLINQIFRDICIVQMEKWLNCFKTKQHFLSWDIVHWKVISRHHTKVGLEDGPSNECEYISRDLREESHEQLSCGCHKLDGFLEEHRRLAVKSGDWIQLSYQILSCTCKVGHPGCITYTGVIIYEPPTVGSRHCSLKSLGSTEQVREHFKSPMWIDALYKKQPLSDLIVYTLSSLQSTVRLLLR